MTGIPTSKAPEPGQLIGGRYRVERIIGSGGMATVWSGRDTVLDRKVAVKVLHPHLATNQSFVQRFRQEARAAAKLSHPGIVAVYDTVTTDDADAIVMELVEGITLGEYMAQAKPMGVRQAITAVTAVAEALDVAHRNGVIHRDIKPGNILLCTNGRVKIADFGIAKAGFAENGPDAWGDEPTQTDVLLGTASYLAPEQVEGTPVDGRADIYSLAIVLYQLLCKRKPFTGDSDTAIALARLHRDAIPLDQMSATIPTPVSAVVEKAMSRDREDRYRTAGEFRAALLDAEHNKATVMPTRPTVTTKRHGPTSKPSSRQPATAAPEKEQSVTAPHPAKRTRADPSTVYSKKPPSSGYSRSLWVVAVVGLILGSLILILALVSSRSTPDDTANEAPPTEAKPVLDIVATPFDPEGTGTPGENNAAAPKALDGDVDTAWRSETYETQSFGLPGTKAGVGFSLDLGTERVLESITVESATPGWVGEIYVLDSEPTEVPGENDRDGLVAKIEFNQTETVALDGSEGRFVLIWMQELGEVDSGFRVDLSEITVFERSPSS